ncbi:amino acid adenylation domain-containing protein [Desulfovibrio aminophilus]|uniref:amino acid adenylation domain-containing protein n=1 Tax=Desulfovibrio aminophilus TaxID=81425 RepID=UPI0003F881C4|nr:amino acid adenylation domain-containing protein [Desulfovibrio aminophilus]
MTPSIINGFLQNAKQAPSAPALFVQDAFYSYADLAAAGASIREALVAQAATEELIGVFAYRSLPMFIGILGTLMAGKCYVPLNPTFPAKRLKSVVLRSGMRLVLTEEKYLDQILEVLQACEGTYVLLVVDALAAGSFAAGNVVVHNQQHTEARALEPQALRPVEVQDNGFAYLLFTSGSTGDPKGVGITHANVNFFVNAVQRKYRFAASDRFSQLFDFTFDLSAFDMFVAWSAGAAVYCPPKEECLAPVKFVKKHELTVWFSVPSTGVLMARFDFLKPGNLPSLRFALFCGEALLCDTARQFLAAAPQALVENLYGPTEATIAFTAYPCTQASLDEKCRNGVVPIGKPFEGLVAAVVDENLRPLPRGEVGELCLGGAQIAPGYWEGEALTRAKFLSLPHAGAPEIPWYRTGDLAYCDADGDLFFLGRKDDQIQIAGYRVELGEIEHVLRQATGISHVAAIGWRQAPNHPLCVVAFVAGRIVDSAAIIERCAESLPNYMVPHKICSIVSMPLNSNGKIDRNTLAQMVTGA